MLAEGRVVHRGSRVATAEGRIVRESRRQAAGARHVHLPGAERLRGARRRRAGASTRMDALDELAVALRGRLIERARAGEAGDGPRGGGPAGRGRRGRLAARGGPRGAAPAVLPAGHRPRAARAAAGRPGGGRGDGERAGGGVRRAARADRAQRASRSRARRELLHAIERVLAPLGRRVDEASPLCDARLADGSRVNVVIPPLALDGPVPHDPALPARRASRCATSCAPARCRRARRSCWPPASRRAPRCSCPAAPARARPPRWARSRAPSPAPSGS